MTQCECRDAALIGVFLDLCGVNFSVFTFFLLWGLLPRSIPRQHGLHHTHTENLLCSHTLSASVALKSLLWFSWHRLFCICTGVAARPYIGTVRFAEGHRGSRLQFIYCYIRPHRKSNCRAPVKCFCRSCQKNLDPSVVADSFERYFGLLIIFTPRKTVVLGAHASTHRAATAVDHLTLNILSHQSTFTCTHTHTHTLAHSIACKIHPSWRPLFPVRNNLQPLWSLLRITVAGNESVGMTCIYITHLE